MSPLELTLVGSLVFVIAGSVKGMVGIGLPTAAISMLTLFVDPRMAIALTLGPMVFSNAWQVWLSGAWHFDCCVFNLEPAVRDPAHACAV